jgi:hypothetical protein
LHCLWFSVFPKRPLREKWDKTYDKIRIITMTSATFAELIFKSQTVSANFIDPDGQMVKRPIEIRTHPITGRTSRIAFSRINEKEAATDTIWA